MTQNPEIIEKDVKRPKVDIRFSTPQNVGKTNAQNLFFQKT